MGDFSFSDVCCKCSTAERKPSWRFLKHVEGNFLMQMASEPTREVAVLDLLFVNRRGLVGDVTVGSNLRHTAFMK